MPRFSTCLFLILSLALSACAPKHPRSQPQTTQPAAPEHWGNTQQKSEAAPAAWLDSFADPQLNKLIDEALSNNYDLQRLAALVKSAQAKAQLAGADLLPSADLQFAANRHKSTIGNNPTIGNSFALQGTLSWEIDLWNRLSYGEQASLADVAAAQADRSAAKLSLAAAVARNWFRLTEAQRQLQLSEETEDSYQKSLQVIDEQYRNGLNSALDLRLARASLANAQSVRADRQRARDQQRRELEILLGRYPAGELHAPDQLPQLVEQIPVGLPSTLLERRPDLRAADLQLTAAGLRAEAASRNRLPIFKLTSSVGTASDKLYQLLDWDYLLWSIAGSVVQPLFDGGQRTAELLLADSQQERQLAEYATLALNAYREVETALAAESYLQQQESALQRSVSEAVEAQLLAEQRYLDGLEGIITLLETQRRAFSARIALLTTSRQRLENRINLHLALGGPFAIDAQSTSVEGQP